MLSLASLFGQLNNYLGVYGNAQMFIDTKLPELLQQIGDNLMSIAEQHLNDAGISKNPIREREAHLNALIAAYKSYRNSADKSGLGTLVGDVVEHFTFRSSSRKVKGYHKACQASILVATGYKQLGENQLAKQYMRYAKECFDLCVKARLDASYSYGGVGAMPVGGSLAVEGRDQDEEEKLIQRDKEEFDKLVKKF